MKVIPTPVTQIQIGDELAMGGIVTAISKTRESIDVTTVSPRTGKTYTDRLSVNTRIIVKRRW